MDLKENTNKIIKLLETALKHAKGEYSIESIFQRVREQTLQLWNFEDAIVLTELVVYPMKTRVHIFLAAGVYHPEYLQTIENFARKIGANGVQWSGREGWIRRTASEGYEKSYVVMVKDFEDE